jgi:hypothetical protein
MSLYNPGFLGEHFNWWIGQIADDSTWRDNILPGKFTDRNSVVGWGYRYKVRIIGLHDQDEESLRSEELAWAQVMYPVTAGGGQSSASQTPNLRQGNFVFGFFLDGQDQQVPVIMGVLGNNAQTTLSNKTALTGGKNFSPQSGFANTQEPKVRDKKEKVPDEEKVIVKPKTPEQTSECAPAPPNVFVNEYGLRSDKSLTSTQLADAQSARAEADQKGLTGAERDNYVQQKVAQGIKNRCREASSPASLSQPGATKESTNAVHQIGAGDKKRQDKYQERIPLLKPDDKVGSAIKAIQTVLDNLLQEISKYLNALKCYADAVSSIIKEILSLISKAACIIAKYIKIIFDKIMEYVLKLLNKELSKIVSAMPSSMRHMIADLKEIITELILCLYNKITQGLCGLIESLLLAALQPEKIEQQARQSTDDRRKNPYVPMCYAEEIVGQAISFSKNDITDANNTLINNVNAFLGDIQGQISGVNGPFSDITSLIGNIDGSMTSALSFENLKLNLFGCELKPNVAVSDYYTFARGGASQPEPQTPNLKSVEDIAAKTTSVTPTAEVPYVEPTKATPDVNLKR